MRASTLVAIGCLLTACSWGQVGLEGQSAKNPDLVRALDAASAAFANAQRDAASGNKTAFAKSLNEANVRWAECFSHYREWATSDTAWRPNFDAINTALLNAVNALTPGDNLPAAKVQIDAAASTLAGLRSRNGVLDLPGSMEKLQASIDGLQTTIAGLQAGAITPADIAALKTSFGTFRDSYALFTQAAYDANAFGLGQGELASLQKMVAVQNVGIDTFYNVLSNPNTPQLVTQWQSLRDQIVTMLTELNQKAPANAETSATEAKSGSETGQTELDDTGRRLGRDRPRLLPRLRDR